MARKPRAAPFPVRLTDEQRAELTRRADRAGLSVGGYLVSAALGRPPPRHSRRPSVDQKMLAQVLGAVGRIGSNVNQLARIANSGDWPEREDIEAARADILWMRDMLFVALGVKLPPNPPKPEAEATNITGLPWLGVTPPDPLAQKGE
ncbi:MAG: MobC family plasmid mobilization relaxosome protein [Pseudomonadota bacterium]|nr:MobC family plasmid mobilization relaxosome protein [Pseudomonadota bacterium]